VGWGGGGMPEAVGVGGPVSCRPLGFGDDIGNSAAGCTPFVPVCFVLRRLIGFCRALPEAVREFVTHNVAVIAWNIFFPSFSFLHRLLFVLLPKMSHHSSHVRVIR
jgi:hypothetical protein